MAIGTNEITEKQTLPDDVLYEVIDGRIVELPPMGTPQEITSGILFARLSYFVDSANLGIAVMETLFDFTAQVGHKRRPDAAFVSAERWPESKPVPQTDGWAVVPDLVVEVISPSNSWDEVTDKIHEYFQVGVRRVWVVATSRKQVHIYLSPTSVRILALDDTLADDELLPGLKLPLSELFKRVE